ncbi:MAG: STAS domain-containing protein [Candidatus Omnitrophica bacterium]|nr:STAS domain-containing protein [Candidatus Omnitrophota bacterium]MBU4487820.1 STAS domain-containing protein [Candidatus Omnitrophota bacterium]MCG2705540.1 STAS domain-containing protein [Candidatus Omnitrophota bacterium]
MALDIKVVKKKNYVYNIELAGSLDSETYQELEDEITEINDDNIRALALDMGGVDYLSSAGIRVIISTEKALKRKQAAFAIINLQPQIKRVLDVMKILPIFNIFDDMGEADKYIDEIIKEEIKKTNT